MDHVVDGDHADQPPLVIDYGGRDQGVFLEAQRHIFLVHVDRDQGLLAAHDVTDRGPPRGPEDGRQLARPNRVVIGADHEHFPEIGRQIFGRTKIIDDLPDLPMRRHGAEVALHQAPGGLLRIAQRLFDRGTVVRVHGPQHRLLLVAVEVLDQCDGVVGLQLTGDVGNLLRLHLVEQVLANVIVEFGQHVGADDAGERLDQPLALVPLGELDQVGDVGRVERLDEPASGLVIALVDRIEDAVHEFRAQAVFLVDRGAVGGVRFGDQVGSDAVIIGHDAPLSAGLGRPSYGRHRSGATVAASLNRAPDQAFNGVHQWPTPTA